jgi:rod shape-determining protein MreB and related proteins
VALSKKIGVDVGRATVTVYVSGEGVVVHEPSRASDGPGLNGALRDLVRRTQGFQRFFKPELMICVSPEVPRLARCAMTEAAIEAGARQAWLIEEPLAAAIGAGLPIEEPDGVLICDIGAGSTEIAIFSGSGTVATRTLPVGGIHLDRAIATFLERRLGLHLEERAAEAAKLEAGAALPVEPHLVTSVGGREVTSTELAAALEPPLATIAAEIADVLEQAAGPLAERLRRRGLTLTGGGARLLGIDRFMAMRLGLPVRVAADPQTCVARGAGLALERHEVLKRNQLYSR